MSLIGLLLFIVILGVLLWLLKAYIPMDQAIKTILTVVIVIIIVLVVLQFFGVINTGVHFGFLNI